jgi:hypothetical protein
LGLNPHGHVGRRAAVRTQISLSAAASETARSTPSGITVAIGCYERTLPLSPPRRVESGRVASQTERCYFAAGLSVSFVSGFAASLSSGGLERWSLLISLAPTEGSSGVTLMPVAMAPEVHLK